LSLSSSFSIFLIFIILYIFAAKRILPFPSLKQFYNEYEASFRPLYGSLVQQYQTPLNKASLTTFREVFNEECCGTARFMRGKGNQTTCEVCNRIILLLI